MKEKEKKEAIAKNSAEIEAKKRKNQTTEEKQKLKKEFTKLLENNLNEA